MNTSSRFAYAVHVLALLSLQEGVPLSSEIIAGSVNTNPALIRRLLSMLAAAGLTTAQIAERLVISPKTADSHIQHIYAKIGCSTRGAAVLFALEHHLAGDPPS
jgi:DNA-binding NarL/FixJ family response regulator